MPNPNSEKTEQKGSMAVPSLIEFHKDSERILRRTLLAVTPQEGCALLIGRPIELHNAQKPNVFKIQLIWPCCNIWISGFHDHVDTYLETKGQLSIKTSRENRFALDPCEQLAAQKWARSRKLEILGTAHSHTKSLPVPSKIDLSWIHWPSLMIILNAKTDEMRAWWVNHSQHPYPLPIPFISEASTL